MSDEKYYVIDIRPRGFRLFDEPQEDGSIEHGSYTWIEDENGKQIEMERNHFFTTPAPQPWWKRLLESFSEHSASKQTEEERLTEHQQYMANRLTPNRR